MQRELIKAHDALQDRIRDFVLATTGDSPAEDARKAEQAMLTALKHECNVMRELLAQCHPDCGPIVATSPDGVHAHENEDGRCWHEDSDR